MQHINTLVQYHGGGYDGCFWEWNFALFDNDGTFHDIFSSGYAGCDSVEKLENIIDDNHTYIYDLTDAEKRVEFVEENVIDNVLAVAKTVNAVYNFDNCYDTLLLVPCDHCEDTFGSKDDLDYMFLTGGQGAGGLAIKHNGVVCGNCFSYHSCGECGEYEADELIYNEEQEMELCQWCNDTDENTSD